MTGRDFTRDDVWQRIQRDRFLPSFYREHGQGFKFLDQLAIGLGDHPPDTLWRRDGKWFAVEEKIVRYHETRGHYEAYTLETESCTIPGRERAGWMRSSEADLLAYGFMTKNDQMMRLHLIPLAPLQRWFWANYEKFPITITNQINRTRCRVTPIADVLMGLIEQGVEVEGFKLRPQTVAVAA